MSSPVSIVIAIDSADVAMAKILFQEYADSIDFSLCYQGFEEELAALPGRYAPPTGRLLLARDPLSGEDLGCAAFREIPQMPGDPGRVCEMKRLYVRPTARGRGVGRALVAGLLDQARQAGYAIMRLDTSRHWSAAIALYSSCGFEPGPMYNDDDHEDTRFFQRFLEPTPLDLSLKSTSVSTSPE